MLTAKMPLDLLNTSKKCIIIDILPNEIQMMSQTSISDKVLVIFLEACTHLRHSWSIISHNRSNLAAKGLLSKGNGLCKHLLTGFCSL